MSAFFELRIYQIFPGKMDEWISFMEKTIMPFQVAQGMVIHGSFIMDSSDQFALENGERVMGGVGMSKSGGVMRKCKNLLFFE